MFFHPSGLQSVNIVRITGAPLSRRSSPFNCAPGLWHQGSLQLLEEQPESSSKPSLCLFSKFVAVKEDLGPARSAFMQAEWAQRTGGSDKFVAGDISKQCGQSAAGRVWEQHVGAMSSGKWGASEDPD